MKHGKEELESKIKAHKAKKNKASGSGLTLEALADILVKNGTISQKDIDDKKPKKDKKGK